MSLHANLLRQSGKLSEASRKAISQHPEEYQLLHDFAVSRLRSHLRGKSSPEALSAASVKASEAILKSSTCRAALQRMASATRGRASQAGATRAKKSVAVVEEIGAGGALVLLAGAFVVGFMIGTWIAKKTGISEGL